jgi:hypothetical protein
MRLRDWPLNKIDQKIDELRFKYGLSVFVDSSDWDSNITISANGDDDYFYNFLAEGGCNNFCCGIEELGNFEYEKPRHVPNADWLLICRLAIYKRLRLAARPYWTIATTPQVKKIEEILKDTDFKHVKTIPSSHQKNGKGYNIKLWELYDKSLIKKAA